MLTVRVCYSVDELTKENETMSKDMRSMYRFFQPYAVRSGGSRLRPGMFR